MARIPENILQHLKSEISLQRLMEATGVKLKPHGQDLIGLCPFHDDKEPSLVITPAKNLWHCLGACQTGGSVIDWVMKREGVSFRHAVELLQADYQPVQVTTAPVKQTRTRKLDSPIPLDTDDNAALMQVVDYYHATLKQSPEALAYLQQRGIDNPEVIDQFKLGYANRTLGYRLPEKNRKEGKALRSQLQTLGIYRQSGHEHFNGSLVIPVINDSQVLEMYGRKVTKDNKLTKGTPLHLYLPGPHQGVFNLEAFKVSKEIILCESLIDALTFWCAGFRNVTTSYGCEGFTSYHINALHQYETERVLIAYDRDEAGNKAAEKVTETLIKMGIDCYRVLFPKGMDANEYALSVKPANKSLGLVIRKAEWLGKGQASTDPTTPLIQENNTPPSLAAELQDVADALDAEMPLPATPLPAPPHADVPTHLQGKDLHFTFGDRQYRIRGFDPVTPLNMLKINLLVSGPGLNGEGLHVDTFDLYQSRPRTVFIKQAAIELGVKDDVIKADVGKVFRQLEDLQQHQDAPNDKTTPKAVTGAQREAAFELLKSQDLMQRLLRDFKSCGVVGEETNKLVGYLAAVSRKLDKPLAVLIQSSSAAGKSILMDAVLRFIPEEEKIQYSAMTGQALFYMSELDLQHKILAIAEEEGAQRASYALKLLQSEGNGNGSGLHYCIIVLCLINFPHGQKTAPPQSRWCVPCHGARQRRARHLL